MGTWELELADKRRVLIEVAVPNPRRPHDEVDDTWPTHMRLAVRPHLEIGFLIQLQLRRSEFLSFTFILDSLLAGPAEHERACGPRVEIRILAGTLDRIEDDLEVWRRREAHQCRLRCAGITDRAENTQPILHDESVEVRLSHHRGKCTGLPFGLSTFACATLAGSYKPQ